MTNVLFCPECPECGSPTMQVQYGDGHYQPHCKKCKWPLKWLPKRVRYKDTLESSDSSKRAK